MGKRTTAPERDNKYYISAKHGGKNPCIVRNSGTGSVLPNCVGYAYGRFMEIMGAEGCDLCTGNAENWFGFTSDGYRRGTEPKVGAVACWRKGEAYNSSDGAGHVAVVEEVKENGDILCSNSDYYGRVFYMAAYTRASGYSLGSAYTFQGFIYSPKEALPIGKIGTPVARNAGKMQLEITAASLRARKRPELSDEVIVGIINPGIYDILEQRDMTHEASNGYLWYRIGDGIWVASREGEWTHLVEPAGDAAELQRLRQLIEGAIELLKKA